MDTLLIFFLNRSLLDIMEKIKIWFFKVLKVKDNDTLID